MADDKSNRGPQDRARINTSEDYELQYWSDELGVSPDELKRLVAKHGTSADVIRTVLAKR